MEIHVSDSVKKHYVNVVRSEFKNDITKSDWGWSLDDFDSKSEVNLSTKYINNIKINVQCIGWNIIIKVYRDEYPKAGTSHFIIKLKSILNFKLLYNIIKNSILLLDIEKNKEMKHNDSFFINNLPVKDERKLKLNKIFDKNKL